MSNIPEPPTGKKEPQELVKIPEYLWEHINNAYPRNVCLVSTLLPDGYSQVSPRGSMVVYDADTLAYWNLGSGSTRDAVADGTKVTVFFHDPGLPGKGILAPRGGARFYGTASLHTLGEVRDRVWDLQGPPIRERDPDCKGTAVLVRVERAEDLSHEPLE